RRSHRRSCGRQRHRNVDTRGGGRDSGWDERGETAAEHRQERVVGADGHAASWVSTTWRPSVSCGWAARYWLRARWAFSLLPSQGISVRTLRSLVEAIVHWSAASVTRAGAPTGGV